MRCRLRTLLIVVTALCVGLGYVSYKRSVYGHQQLACGHIVDLAGGLSRKRPTTAPWMKSVLGDDQWSGVERVWLERTAIQDDDLAHIAYLSKLEMIDLRRTEITDAGLAHLESLDSLQEVRIVGTATTSRGRERLKLALPHAQISYIEGEASRR